MLPPLLLPLLLLLLEAADDAMASVRGWVCTFCPQSHHLCILALTHTRTTKYVAKEQTNHYVVVLVCGVQSVLTLYRVWACCSSHTTMHMSKGTLLAADCCRL